MNSNSHPSGDLIGKLVRWDDGKQWFTARITEDACSGSGAQWIGEVVDPGNFIGAAAAHPYFEETPLAVGERLPNLLTALFTVIDES